MTKPELSYDPYNVVITGVGGQGNVLASKVLGNMLSEKGLQITIGETFGASQRGGSVMSHLRISAASSWSPLIPKGQAHMIIALEPIEALRVLREYGSPITKVLCNMRPIHPVTVISGEVSYPATDELENWVKELTQDSWFVNATDAAMKMGNPIYGNIIMIGALAGIGELPLDRQDFKQVISSSMPADKVEDNLCAYDMGVDMIGA